MLLGGILQFVNENAARYFHLSPRDFSVELLNNADDLHEGMSAHPVFLVKKHDGTLLFIVKVYSKFTVSSEFLKQWMINCKQINTLGLTNCSVALPFTYSILKEWSLTAISAATGRSLNGWMRCYSQITPNSPEHQRAFTQLLSIVQKCAKALAELHHAANVKNGKVSQVIEKKEATWINYFNYLLKNNPKFRHMQNSGWQNTLMALADKAYNTTFHTAYVHGDPSPGNIFFDEKNDQITLIDLDHALSSSMDANEFAIGPISYDYVTAFESLALTGRAHGLHDQQIRALQSAFADAYRQQAGKTLFTDTQLRYHTCLFWIKKIIQFHELPDYFSSELNRQAHAVVTEAIEKLEEILLVKQRI
ncbi:MAG: phosphotransferase [Chlamydiales bacterium]|nr:phosphotransferase [Chlamydiia bacterium]MCP5506991.1 phosphotransferase [Chlamydiales bacterium]